MVDLALEELRFPATADDWHEVARELALGLREVLRAHPAVTMLIATGPPTPGTVNATIRALTLLQAAGLDADVAARVQRSVISYLVGWVLIEQGVATEQRQANFAAALHLAQGRSGADAAAVAAAIAPDRSAKGEFEFGLELILHGLAARLASSSPAAP